MSHCDQCGSCVSLRRVRVKGAGWRTPETRLWCARCRGEEPVTIAPRPPVSANQRGGVKPMCPVCARRPIQRVGICGPCVGLLESHMRSSPHRLPGASTKTRRALLAVDLDEAVRWHHWQTLQKLRAKLQREQEVA